MTDQLASIVKEYVNARLDGNVTTADNIWKANPDLQDRFVVAFLEAKGERLRDSYRI